MSPALTPHRPRVFQQVTQLLICHQSLSPHCPPLSTFALYSGAGWQRTSQEESNSGKGSSTSFFISMAAQCPFTVLHLQLGALGEAAGPPVPALCCGEVAVAWRPSSGFPFGATWPARAWGRWQSGLLGCGVYSGVGEVLKEGHVHVSLEDGGKLS